MKEGAEPAFLEAGIFVRNQSFRSKTTTAEEGIAEYAKIVNYIRDTYQLNNEQVNKILGYISKNGMKYVLDKIALTERQPRDNMAAFFLAAFAMTTRCLCAMSPQKRLSRSSQPFAVLPEPEVSDETRRISAQTLREWRLKYAMSPGVPA